jgi:hypothetical protein
LEHEDGAQAIACCLQEAINLAAFIHAAHKQVMAVRMGLADRMTRRSQHVPGGRQQDDARRRQLHATAAAVQQGGAGDLFQPMDLLAEVRLGDEQPLRSAGEGACVRYRGEVPQVPQLNTLRRPPARHRRKRHCYRWCLIHVCHLCPTRAARVHSGGPVPGPALARPRCRHNAAAAPQVNHVSPP